MEKNSKTIIINNLQKTLNLLEKIDLTGGVKLTPKQLQERVQVYLRTKEEILGKIDQISRKLGVFKQSYTDTQTELQRISAQNTELNNAIEEWNKWEIEENRPTINEYKRQLDTKDATISELTTRNTELQRESQSALQSIRDVDEDINEISRLVQGLASVISPPR